MADKTRITIIGGGVGGYPAAIRAARMGAEVTLIEKDALGGTCLNRGCIPTKALLQSANVVRTMKESEVFGVEMQGLRSGLRRRHGPQEHRRGAAHARRRRLLKAEEGKGHPGTACFVDPKTVQVNETGEKIQGDKILIASGSTPGRIPIEGIDGPDVMDSNQVLAMKALPKSVVVIGGGVIGVEFAQFLIGMGTEVTIIEMLPRSSPAWTRKLRRCSRSGSQRQASRLSPVAP